MRPIKVLLVEDSPTDARLLMADLVDESGALFDVVWVECMADAITQLQKQTFDVSLLDLSLPDSFGMDTYAKIQEVCPVLPVVVLTGAVNEAVGIEAIRLGVQDYLVKGTADGKTVARSIRYAVERKNAEDALRQSDARFRQLAEAAFEGLLIHDNGIIMDANSPLAQIIGYDVADLPGKSIYGFIDVKYHDLMKKESTEPYQVEAVHKTGMKIPVEFMAKPFIIGDRKVTVAAVRNVLERNLLEAQRKQLADELEKRVEEVQATNTALMQSQRAALNLMEDALEARKQTEFVNNKLEEISEQRGIALSMQQKLVTRFELLSHTASSLLQSSDPRSLVESLCRKVMVHLDCQVFFNFIVEEKEKKLRLNAWAGIPVEEARRIEWLEYGVAVCGCVARDGSRIVAENIQNTPDVRTDLVKSYGIKAYACHPIMGPEETVLGTLSFGTKTRESFSTDDLSLMKAVTDLVAIALTRTNNERELLRSKEEWVETFNVIPDHIAILDNKHRIIRANKAMANKLGLLPDEIEGLSCHMCIHGTKDPISGCPHSMLLKDGKQHVAEVFEEKLGGSFLVSVSPIVDKFGVIKGSVHVARDISEQKKREEELYKLNRTLEALSKSSQAMTRTSDEREFLDEVCRIVVNDCGYAMVWIGYAQDDEAKTIKPVAHAGFENGYLDTLNLSWDDSDRGKGPTGTAIRTGTISKCSDMISDPLFGPWRKEATKRGYASSICVPLTMFGNPFGAITIYSSEPNAFSESESRLLGDLANDLAYGITTIRLRAAQAKSEESLRNEHNFINTILQTTGGLIAGFDTHGRIKIFNHACERATGYSFNEVRDRVFWDFLLVPEEIEAVKRVFNNLSTFQFQSEFENYWVTSNGSRRFIRWTNSTVVDKQGDIELVIGTGIDITERKQAEIELEQYKTDLERLVRERTAALRASEEQLMRANEMKLLGQLTSGVAHEVRNPLNGIIAIMGALSKELSDSDHFEPYVKHMRNQVTRLTVLMEDLLMLGRPIQKEKMIRIPFVKFIRESIATWQSARPDRSDIRFDESGLENNGAEILADTARLEQMVVNLLDNATQHTPADKGIDVMIFKPDGAEILYCVKDRGAGIPAEVLPRIFEPFFTTRKGGTGLGLSIVKHIVESHGGTISAANNEDGIGATFTVKLPVAAPGPDPA